MSEHETLMNLLLQVKQQNEEILAKLSDKERPDDKLDLVDLEVMLGTSSRALANRARDRRVKLYQSDKDKRCWAILRKDLPTLTKKFTRQKRTA